MVQRHAESVGEKIRRGRVLKGLSQEDLADQSRVARWKIVAAEANRLRQLRPDEVLRIAKVISGDDVAKVLIPADVSKQQQFDLDVQHLFDDIEVLAHDSRTSETERNQLATGVIALRRLLGIDVEKFVS